MMLGTFFPHALDDATCCRISLAAFPSPWEVRKNILVMKTAKLGKTSQLWLKGFDYHEVVFQMFKYRGISPKCHGDTWGMWGTSSLQVTMAHFDWTVEKTECFLLAIKEKMCQLFWTNIEMQIHRKRVCTSIFSTSKLESHKMRLKQELRLIRFTPFIGNLFKS